MADTDRCTETTAKGTPCQRKPVKGDTKCASHLGTAHRPTKLTEDVHHNIVALLQNGNYAATAARACGISEATYYAWIERGEADLENGVDSQFSEFAEACARARGVAEASLLQKVQVAAGKDWRAAAWALERMFPDRYGQRQQVKHSGSVRTNAPEVPEDDDRLSEVGSILAGIGALPAAE